MKTGIRILLMITFCLTGLVCIHSKKPGSNDKTIRMKDTLQFKQEAKNLVNGLRQEGIADERVLNAIEKIPRHEFVEKGLVKYAYEDRPLPIGRNQTISQPFTVAYQTELLQLKPGDKVLEIGTGSGYQAAVLCEMNVEVYSIERHQPLYLKAKTILNELGYSPHLFYGDGYEGLPDHAPFDKILITAATKSFPQKLKEQLGIGGMMVAPVGDDVRQVMTVIKRVSENKYEETEHGFFRFVPMLEGMAK